MAGAIELNEPHNHITRSEYHHGSHRNLLFGAPSVVPRAGVDAIIVPTARRAHHMRHAIELAADLGCTLIALCSKRSSARAVVHSASGTAVDLLAIDLRDLPAGLIPPFETCEVLTGSRFERLTDVSLKRNLGIMVARLSGWQGIVFLDDDVLVPDPWDLNRAVGLTGGDATVGLSIGGYPDNSVVCHAYRDAGGPQEMFIGGGALAVGAGSMSSFFPNIYNEDWFFLLDDRGLRRSAVTGTAIQARYDPFASEERARSEEFGDCLAEGLFWLLDNGKSLADATVGYWQQALERRSSFISEVITMVRRMRGDPAVPRMLNSLEAARDWCSSIEPELCSEYVLAWKADRARWTHHLEELQATHRPVTPGESPEKVLASLGLPYQTT